MQADRQSAQQLRKSINKLDQQKKPILILVDKICQKIGRQTFAYIFMIISQILYPLGFLFSNENKLHPVQTNLMRGCMVIILSTSIAKYFNLDLTYKNPYNFRILMLRNLLTCIQAFGYTIVQFYLPQPIVQTLNSTGPLFVFLLDYQINNVKITKNQLIGILLGVSGVIFTINGKVMIQFLDPTYESKSDFENYQTSDTKIQILMSLVFIFSTFLWAYAQIITKRLVGANSIQVSIHLAYYLVFTSGLLYPIQVSQPVSVEIFIKGLFFGALLIALSQMMYFGALIMTKNTGNITMMIFVGVIVGYVVSVLRYNQPVNPICTIGSILIVMSIAKIVLKQKQKKSQENN